MQTVLPILPSLLGMASPKVLAQFDAGKPDTESGIVLLPDSGLGRYQRDGISLLCLEPSARYYEEDVWRFRIIVPELRIRRDVVVEVEFWDEGFGIIEAQRSIDLSFNGLFARSARAVSYTRLNSLRYRSASFLFTEGPKEPSADANGRTDFKITGLQHLRSIRLIEPQPESYWIALQSEIPRDIVPAVSLRRPMQVVCSAGVEVLGDVEQDFAGMLDRSVANLREQAPLAKALGFNAVEAYVRWNVVEPRRGEFDWTFYDTLVEELRPHGLKLFPLLIVGSAYALPRWFYESDENVGFVCLEHGLSNPVQSIWSPFHKPHVTRFLQAFGAHYEPMGCLQGVRLGPSGCYGESQYPAQGDWGFRGHGMHLHIGMWAGDSYARTDFQRFLEEKYGTVSALNEAWDAVLPSFDAVSVTLPEQCLSKRQRLDTYVWYTDSMTNWCEWWAIEARKAMPNTPIYQSAGGWGAAEIGTDYSGQTKSMLKVDGGIRLTNELDSFHQAFYATRLAATSARLYGVPLGFEPAMGHTARGTAGRLFNCISNGGEHFFTYGANVFNRQTSIDRWLAHYALFDSRSKPVVDVALVYPQTMNFVSQDTFRYLNAWGFNPVAREIRDRIEVDYLDNRLILDGFLDQYKVLVFVWGNQLEEPVIQKIDAWLRAGGIVVFPCQLYSKLATVEGDTAFFDRWVLGDVGKGHFFRYAGDDEPPTLYAEYVKSVLLSSRTLSPLTRIALEMERPANVFISAQEEGVFLILNFGDETATVHHSAIGEIEVPPYGIARAFLLASPEM
ncbi:MAG: hypothetical protein QG656_756 [Candidatus Hydrogenedentes bacterium]|nr:hypothetical protein [Candidatus Hydrogenedentota bacterium]